MATAAGVSNWNTGPRTAEELQQVEWLSPAAAAALLPQGCPDLGDAGREPVEGMHRHSSVWVGEGRLSVDVTRRPAIGKHEPSLDDVVGPFTTARGD